jgi:hypothetical protein
MTDLEIDRLRTIAREHQIMPKERAPCMHPFLTAHRLPSLNECGKLRFELFPMHRRGDLSCIDHIDPRVGILTVVR